MTLRQAEALLDRFEIDGRLPTDVAIRKEGFAVRWPG